MRAKKRARGLRITMGLKGRHRVDELSRVTLWSPTNLEKESKGEKKGIVAGGIR